MDTFPDGYVRIGVAVKQQERGLDLIGVEQRALLGKELRGVPRISAGIRYGAIAISPITFSPLATQRANTGMADSGGENVRTGL